MADFTLPKKYLKLLVVNSLAGIGKMLVFLKLPYGAGNGLRGPVPEEGIRSLRRRRSTRILGSEVPLRGDPGRAGGGVAGR